MFRKINYYGYKETIMYLVGSEQSGSQWGGASLKRSHVFDEILRTTLMETGIELSFQECEMKGSFESYTYSSHGSCEISGEEERGSR